MAQQFYNDISFISRGFYKEILNYQVSISLNKRIEWCILYTLNSCFRV